VGGRQVTTVLFEQTRVAGEIGNYLK